MINFEIGIYLHARPVTDLQKEALPPSLERKRIALAMDSNITRGKGHELTLLASHEISLEDECKKLLKEGFQVKVAIPPRIELLRDLKVVRLSSLDVSFDLMAFDLVRPVSGFRTEFHAPLFSHEGPSVLQTLEDLHAHGIGRHRVRLGLADFGVIFKDVSPGLWNTGYGQPCHGPQEMSEISAEALTLYLKNHPEACLFYTAVAGAFQSFIYNPVKGDWISFDDLKTQQSKMAWARREGLRGVFIWH